MKDWYILQNEKAHIHWNKIGRSLLFPSPRLIVLKKKFQNREVECEAERRGEWYRESRWKSDASLWEEPAESRINMTIATLSLAALDRSRTWQESMCSEGERRSSDPSQNQMSFGGRSGWDIHGPLPDLMEILFESRRTESCFPFLQSDLKSSFSLLDRSTSFEKEKRKRSSSKWEKNDETND